MSEVQLASFFEAAIKFMDQPENVLTKSIGVASSATADLGLYSVHNPMGPTNRLAHATAERLYADLERFFGNQVEHRPELADRPFPEFARTAPQTRFIDRDRTQFWPIRREPGTKPLWLSVRQAPWQGYGSFARVDIQRPKLGTHVAILR
ncbi:hypothetical protein HYS97_00415 [Candidatus Daviesbacteria bacterium]|nr:hypothetical protein [Candidatus Daviesbacteria bacterium]